MFSVLALSSLTLLARDARADVDIPTECGTRAAFDAELRKRLGRDAPVESVHVSIDPGPERYHLRVEIGAELRELDDASCPELFRAAIVVAVAMLMRDRTLPPSEPTAAPAPARRATPGLRPRITLSAGIGATVGTLPGPTATLELESQALWRHWGAALGARYVLPSEKLDDQQRGATLQALGAHAAAIFRPARAWQARLGFAAQRLSGHGRGSLKTQSASIWTAGPTLGLGYVPYEQGAFWLGLGAEGQLNAVRGSFQILNYNQEDDRDVHRVPWLSGAAFVRLGLVW
jgi:hypothetical protein